MLIPEKWDDSLKYYQVTNSKTKLTSGLDKISGSWRVKFHDIKMGIETTYFIKLLQTSQHSHTDLAIGSSCSFTWTRCSSVSCLQRSLREKIYGERGWASDTKSISNITLFLRASSSCREKNNLFRKVKRNDYHRFILSEKEEAILPSKYVRFLQPQPEDVLRQ